MEHKHKSLATASSLDEGACADYAVDRLSNVPREVAHHILSLVDFKDLIRVGSVSKRCREFYLSTPSLKFSSPYIGNRQKQLNLLNCIDRYMIHHGDDKIKSFCINWDFSAGISEEGFRMMTWVLIAVRCNVEVLDLELRLNAKDGATLELPCCIYSCESLRSLSVKTRTILKAPLFACSNNLQYLKLKNVRMDEGFGKWISCSCKCIKDIWVEDVCVDSFAIESSSLESFTLLYTYNCDPCHFSISGEILAEINIQWETSQASSSIVRSLNVDAPNLKYLKWIGNLLSHQNLGKFMCLENARIFLKHRGDDYDFDNAFDVLCSLYRVKSLVLSEETTKLLLREGSMHAPLDDTTYLGLHIMSLTDDLVPAIASLLRGMPNLKTLYINSYPSLHIVKPKACGFKRKYWKSQNLDCIHQLEEVSVSLSTGYPNNALELATYILEHAPNLKKMVICYLPHQSYIIGKVNKSKIISSATVVFQKREVNEDEAMGESYYSIAQGRFHACPIGCYYGLHIMSLTDDLVPAMASLLRGMPNLKTLYINSYPSLHIVKSKACGFKRKYWKSQNLDCIHQLEEVSVNALELATYILEHAPKLKKMVICYLPHQSYVLGKVNKSKIISSATVIFQKRGLNEDEVMGESYYCKLFHLRQYFSFC